MIIYLNKNTELFWMEFKGMLMNLISKETEEGGGEEGEEEY